MRLLKLIILVSFMFVLLFTEVVLAQTTDSSTIAKLNYPQPALSENLLFYIQRSFNHNTIVYELNVDDEQKLYREFPIHPYWIRYEDGGGIKELSYIENKLAYGIKTTLKSSSNLTYDLELVSYPLNMELRKSAITNRYRVYVTVNGKNIELKKIYFETNGGTFWNPSIQYFDIYGINTDTRQEVCERFIP